MAGNFGGNVFEEIDADEGEVLVKNKRSLLEENDVVVLEDSEKENEIQLIFTTDEAPVAHEGVKVYTSQSTTSNQRRQFQNMFVENGFEIYEHRELVEIKLPRKTEAEKAAENRRLIVSELIERTRNAYWRMEDKGSPEEKSEFIKDLKNSLEIVLNK
ncbi:42484_t:CDS:2 [Gigaspora margarita]|uniref:42484_t:CDS:1 n=1 Tax=Gigaspora margarita TaxID=4874 RepID=A0ABN7V5W8_GIGMA|nr:42484_t:CDS:2 [Gigaspora margarita]